MIKKIKKPLKSNYPDTGKIPRRMINPESMLYPEFKTDKMQKTGEFGFSNLDGEDIELLLRKIFSFQKTKWSEIVYAGSHPISIEKLSPIAKKELIKSGNEDIDGIYSFKISSIIRLWGIKDRNIIWILWWDPKHQVCPSKKKHT